MPECCPCAVDAVAGRILHILPARERPEDVTAGTKKPKKSSSYKEQKKQRLQEDASNVNSWNSLFLRSDTVVTKLAEELGVLKSDILDRNSSSMAVQVRQLTAGRTKSSSARCAVCAACASPTGVGPSSFSRGRYCVGCPSQEAGTVWAVLLKRQALLVRGGKSRPLGSA